MHCCRFYAILSFVVLPVIGCGDGVEIPELAEVTGLITVDGTPTEGLTVTFEPKGAGASTGITDAAGTYKLYFNAQNSGAVPGMHTVRITQQPDAERTTDELRIPRSYNEDSANKAEVKAGVENKFDFEITIKPAG